MWGKLLFHHYYFTAIIYLLLLVKLSVTKLNLKNPDLILIFVIQIFDLLLKIYTMNMDTHKKLKETVIILRKYK